MNGERTQGELYIKERNGNPYASNGMIKSACSF